MHMEASSKTGKMTRLGSAVYAAGLADTHAKDGHSRIRPALLHSPTALDTPHLPTSTPARVHCGCAVQAWPTSFSWAAWCRALPGWPLGSAASCKPPLAMPSWTSLGNVSRVVLRRPQSKFRPGPRSGHCVAAASTRQLPNKIR